MMPHRKNAFICNNQHIYSTRNIQKSLLQQHEVPIATSQNLYCNLPELPAKAAAWSSYGGWRGSPLAEARGEQRPGQGSSPPPHPSSPPRAPRSLLGAARHGCYLELLQRLVQGKARGSGGRCRGRRGVTAASAAHPHCRERRPVRGVPLRLPRAGARACTAAGMVRPWHSSAYER